MLGPARAARGRHVPDRTLAQRIADGAGLMSPRTMEPFSIRRFLGIRNSLESTEALRGVTEAHKALATAHAKLWERYQETLNLVAVAAHVNGEASPMLAMECGKLLRRHNVNATVTVAPLGAGSGRLN